MTTHAVVLIGDRAPEALEIAMRQLGVEVLPLSAQAAEVHLDVTFARKVESALRANTRYDVACIPLENRRKRLLLADMDSTIIGEESLDELAEAFAVGQQVSMITEQAMRGELDFEQALKARVKLLEGVQLQAAADALNKRITYNKGAGTLVATMKAHGAHCALVTGGFDVFAGPVAEKLGFDDVFANRLQSVDGFLTGEVAEPILGRDAKTERLRALADEKGISVDDAVAVGDGANDLGMISAAGLGVGYRPKPVIEEAAAAVIKRGDLTALLALQGIPETEWVRA